MFEATLSEVLTFRKIIDSLKDLVSEVNIEATQTGKNKINFFLLNSKILKFFRLISTSDGFRPC